MHRSTAFFLILLRLAIGWHFLFEGIQKVNSAYVGETTTSRPFSSAGYFREATGPLGSVFRMGVGDPDQEALGRLVVQPLPDGERDSKPGQRMPPLLRQEWHDYVDRFTKHYGLDERQQKEAEGKLSQAESQVVGWLTETEATPTTKEITKRFPGGEVKVKMPTAQRIAVYRASVAEVRDTIEHKLPAFGKDVEGARLRQAKADLAEQRTGLLKDESDYTDRLRDSLKEVLTKDQRERAALPAVEGKFLPWLDWLTRWGLTTMGACLLIGLLTRVNCVLAAGFLLMTYLCAPSFPWLPAAPASEGNYVFVNKNLIEMLALLALATTASGRWFGLDALVHPAVSAVFGRRGKPA